MKKLITASALIALIVSPAFAQTKQNRPHVNAQDSAAQTNAAPPAFAQKKHNRTHVNAQARAAQAKAVQPNAAQADADNKVMWGDTVRGQDPDPFIRGSIRRGLGNYGGD